jgi:hypothetical protein
MKKIILVLGLGILATTMFLNTSTSKSNRCQIDLNSLAKIAKANSEGGSSGYSCTVSSNCFNLMGTVTGSVSCKGSITCKRDYQWVECDGQRTKC